MLLIVLIALLGLSGLAPIPATAAHTPATGGAYLTANGIIIQAGQSLPIFKLTAPALDGPAVSNLSQQFSNIYAGQAVYSDTYRGLTRFTVPNTSTNSILEQFSATGGFYAYNATQAFSEDVPQSQPQASVTGLGAETIIFTGPPNSQENCGHVWPPPPTNSSATSQSPHNPTSWLPGWHTHLAVSVYLLARTGISNSGRTSVFQHFVLFLAIPCR